MSRDEHPIIREHDLEDSALAAAAAHGDQRAFDLLVERYRGYVYAIAYRITLHEDDALDVSQNVLLRLVERIGQFNGAGSFKGWIGALAANEAVTYTRTQRRHKQDRTDLEPDALEEYIPAEGPNVRERLDEDKRRHLVESAMPRPLAPAESYLCPPVPGRDEAMRHRTRAETAGCAST